MDYKLCRRLAGLLFLTGNFLMFFGNLSSLEHANLIQLIIAPIFMTCSVAFSLSAHNHRWLFYCAFISGVGYTLISFSTPGGGDMPSYFGAVAGVLSSLLTLRAAMQRETGKQYKMPAFLSLIDRYPLTATGILNGACCLLTGVSAFISGDFLLLAVESLWMVGCCFIVASDEYLRTALPQSANSHAS